MTKVQITAKLFFGSVCPLYYIISFNISHNTFYLFCFSMHKWNLKLKFCEMMVDIMKYAKKMHHDFFISILTG